MIHSEHSSKLLYLTHTFMTHNDDTVAEKKIFMWLYLTFAVIARMMLLFWWLDPEVRVSVFVLRSCVVGLLLSSGLWNVRRTDRHDTRETTNPFFPGDETTTVAGAAASAFGRPGWADVGDVASLLRKRLPRAHSLGVTGWEETACSNVTTPPCRGFISPFFCHCFPR